jgi:hypothetical protein
VGRRPVDRTPIPSTRIVIRFDEDARCSVDDAMCFVDDANRVVQLANRVVHLANRVARSADPAAGYSASAPTGS